MPAFRPLDEPTLVKLDDAELIDYVLDARAAGNEDEADLALKIFAFGMENVLRAFVRGRLEFEDDTVVEEIVGRALESAVRSISGLRGGTPQEARAFVFKIAGNRIVDFHRKRRLAATSLDDDERRDQLDRQGKLSVEAESDAVDTRLMFDQALAELREDHRAAVELFLITGYSARETAEIVCGRFDGRVNDPMTEQNVNQIVSRFRKDLRVRLGEGGEAVTR